MKNFLPDVAQAPFCCCFQHLLFFSFFHFQTQTKRSSAAVFHMIIFFFLQPSCKDLAADSEPVPLISEFLQTVAKSSRKTRKWSRTVRGVNPKVDGDGRDAFVGPCDPVCLRLNLLADLIEVCELFPLAVKKLSPFWKEEENKRLVKATAGGNKSRLIKRRKWSFCVCECANVLDGVGVRVNVWVPTSICADQLQNQGPAGDNTRSTGQKVPVKIKK